MSTNTSNAAPHSKPRSRKKSAKPIEAASSVSLDAASIDPERLHAMISDAAYYRAEQRAFEPGRELDDWLAAEGEIMRALVSGPTSRA